MKKLIDIFTHGKIPSTAEELLNILYIKEASENEELQAQLELARLTIAKYQRIMLALKPWLELKKTQNGEHQYICMMNNIWEDEEGFQPLYDEFFQEGEK